jgi:hypothetical protein
MKVPKEPKNQRTKEPKNQRTKDPKEFLVKQYIFNCQGSLRDLLKFAIEFYELLLGCKLP